MVEPACQSAIVDAAAKEARRPADPTVIEPRISHAAVLTTAQLSRGLVRMLFVVVAARVLGPEQFGIYALLLATVEMLAVASGTGYMDYLTREAARDERVGWGLGVQLTWLRLGCIVPVSGAGLGALWLLGYSRPVIASAAWILSTLIPRSLTEAVQGVLRGTGHYVEFLVVELFFGLGLVAGAGLLVLWGGGVRTVIGAEFIAAGAAAVAGLVFGLRFRTEHRLHVSLGQLLKTSAIFNVYAFVGNLYDRLDIVLLSKLAGNYATGVYSAAYRPLGTIQLLPYGVLFSLLPALARDQYSQVERERLERAMGLLLNAAFLIVLGTMVFADAAVPVVFGVRFAGTSTALKVLIWAVIFRYLNYALNMGLLAARRERVFVVTSLVCLAVNFIGNLLFIPLYSWRAAAVLTTFTEVVLFGQNIFWLRRSSGTVPKPFGWIRSSLVFAALLVAVVTGAEVASPLAVGSACILLFLIYLYRTGIVDEFAAVWGSGRGVSLEASNS